MYIVQTVVRFRNQVQLHVLFTLFVFVAHSGIQHILCCVVCCARDRLVCPMLPVSVDCLFLIVPSVFSNVYVLLIDMVDVPW